MSPSTRLSADDIEKATKAFAADGYVVFRNVVSKDKLTELRDRIFAAYEAEKASGRLFDGGGGISGHLNCFPGAESRFVKDELDAAGIMDFVRAAFPRNLTPMNAGCNLNLPGSVAQHYHSDSTFRQDFIVVNIAVVDTDLVNGAIDVLPSTHKKFYKFWRYALERAYTRTTRLPMQQGDVLVRVSTLWHRGMPNRSQTARPMLGFTFGERGGHYLNGDDPFGFNGGKVKFLPNWYKTTPLGRLRERTFVTAPITYSAYRFVSSLVDGDKGY